MAKRRTKKDKVIADYRKKAQILETRQTRESVMVFVEDDKPVTRDVRRKNPVRGEKQRNLTLSEKAGLKKQAAVIAGDLRKTVILSVIGIGIILVLYITSSF